MLNHHHHRLELTNHPPILMTDLYPTVVPTSKVVHFVETCKSIQLKNV